MAAGSKRKGDAFDSSSEDDDEDDSAAVTRQVDILCC